MNKFFIILTMLLSWSGCSELPDITNEEPDTGVEEWAPYLAGSCSNIHSEDLPNACIELTGEGYADSLGYQETYCEEDVEGEWITDYCDHDTAVYRCVVFRGKKLEQRFYFYPPDYSASKAESECNQVLEQIENM